MKPPKDPLSATESTLEWWSSPGLVYFVSVGSPPIAVKIGMAAQTKKNTLRSTVIRRLSQIQSSNHELVKLIGIVYFTDGEYPTRNAEILERELHLEFEHLQRFKKHSRGAEWFTAEPELLEKVKSVASDPEGYDLPVYFTESTVGVNNA